MNPKKSSINRVNGSGLARISESRGTKICTGFMVVDRPGDEISLMMGSKNAMFSGTVYEGEKETQLTFPVIMTKITSDRIEFSSLRDPYK